MILILIHFFRSSCSFWYWPLSWSVPHLSIRKMSPWLQPQVYTEVTVATEVMEATEVTEVTEATEATVTGHTEVTDTITTGSADSVPDLADSVPDSAAMVTMASSVKAIAIFSIKCHKWDLKYIQTCTVSHRTAKNSFRCMYLPVFLRKRDNIQILLIYKQLHNWSLFYNWRCPVESRRKRPWNNVTSHEAWEFYMKFENLRRVRNRWFQYFAIAHYTL